MTGALVTVKRWWTMLIKTQNSPIFERAILANCNVIQIQTQ